MRMPINGDRKSSMAAETAERMDKILTARAWGEEEVTVVAAAVPTLVEDAKWRVKEGKGENMTMDMDMTMRKDDWWRTLRVLVFKACVGLTDVSVTPLMMLGALAIIVSPGIHCCCCPLVSFSNNWLVCEMF